VGLFLFCGRMFLARIRPGRLSLLLLLLLLAQALQLLQQLLWGLYLLLLSGGRRLDLFGRHRRWGLLNHRLFGDIVVLVLGIDGRVLPRRHLALLASHCRRRSMGAEHDAFDSARIVNCAHQDEVIARSAQNRVQHLPRSSRSELPKDALSIWLRALERGMSNGLDGFENIGQG